MLVYQTDEASTGAQVTEVEIPQIETPQIETPQIGTPQIETPQIETPEVMEVESAEPVVTQGAEVAPSTELPAGVAPSTELPAGVVGGTAQAVIAPAPRKLIKVSRELTVDPEASGKTVASFIFEAAKRIEANLDEEQIKMSSPNQLADESADTTISKDWTVELEVRSEEDADGILNEWRERFKETPYFPTSSSVGGQIAGETSNQAILAIVASLIGIVAYVWIRFQNLAFGLAAVVALFTTC